MRGVAHITLFVALGVAGLVVEEVSGRLVANGCCARTWGCRHSLRVVVFVALRLSVHARQRILPWPLTSSTLTFNKELVVDM